MRKTYANILGLVATFCVLTGCHSKSTLQASTTTAVSPQAAPGQSEVSQSETPQASTLQTPIAIVRDGYLETNRTTTIGKALAGTFKDGKWTSFTSEKGATVVEFEASEPFGAVLDAGMTCLSNDSCAALYKKISDFCDSPAGWDQATKDYHKENDELLAKASDAWKKDKERNDQGIHDGIYDAEATKLQAQQLSLNAPQNSCVQDSYKQHANDPVAMVVQFTVNHDGTFQYHANNMGMGLNELVAKIYE